MGFYHIERVDIHHIGYGRMALEIQNAIGDTVEWSDKARSVVFAMTPQMVKGWWAGQNTAVMTMWETTWLPRPFRRLCNMFDTLIVPCDWNKELFAPYHNNIHVVPLGVDHALWCPQDAPENSVFRFMTGGSGWERKGIDQVIRAFHDAGLPDSELVIKCPPDIYDDPGEYNLGPNVTLVREALTPEKERDLHASADCFVSGSRGEGFGLIPLQQLALGNMVIGSAHTGHLMFAQMFDYALTWNYGKATMLEHKDCGDWFVPDHDEMVDAMRDAYRKGKPSLEQRKARHVETLPFSWSESGRKLLEAHPPSDELPDLTWVPSGGRRVPVLALKNVRADIGAYQIRISNGEVGMVPVSTLDVLVDNGSVAEL